MFIPIDNQNYCAIVYAAERRVLIQHKASGQEVALAGLDAIRWRHDLDLGANAEELCAVYFVAQDRPSRIDVPMLLVFLAVIGFIPLVRWLVVSLAHWPVPGFVQFIAFVPVYLVIAGVIAATALVRRH